MNAKNEWVPTAAFIEHYVIEEALKRDISIAAASSIVVPRFGLKSDGPFLHSQTRLLGMLYTLLVFPRESWERDGLLEIVVERTQSDRELSNANRKIFDVNFLRSVRNAVSHARIEFSDDTVTFKDGRNPLAPTFEVTFSIKEIVNLLLALGRAFHESAQIKDHLISVGRGKA